MKKLLFASLMLIFALTVSAQKKNEVKVSEKAKTEFAKKFPAATDVKWQKEEMNYEVEFKLNGVETSVDIDSNGKILETESSIANSDLPKGVDEFIAKNYKGWTVTETAKITDDKGVVSFEAQISKGDVSKDLIFGANGKLIEKKSNETEKDEDAKK